MYITSVMLADSRSPVSQKNEERDRLLAEKREADGRYESCKSVLFQPLILSKFYQVFKRCYSRKADKLDNECLELSTSQS